MYITSEKWKEKIYENPICTLNIYIDDTIINPDYILDFKKGGNIFEDELCLGSTPSQYIELKLYKDKIEKEPSKIKIEYGILVNDEVIVATEEINKIILENSNKTQIKSLDNSNFEIIPIGIYNVDDYTDNDDNTITIKALDNMIKFEFNYDGSELISKGEATLLEVAQDICNKAGVELETTSFLNSNKKISVYDNQITAREYIGYIAESAGGFACINREGKLSFREIYQDETTIPLEIFGEYKWGEEFKISKVSYEDGIRDFKFGDDTRNNLWINQENIYIVDEEQIEGIYNKIKGLTANTFEGKTIIDPAIDIGDKIIVDEKSIIYQGEMTFQGRFITQISSKIQIKQKEETTVKKESQKVVNRRIQSRIDQVNGKITTLIQEQTETENKLTETIQEIDGFTQKIATKDELTEKVNELKNTIEGITLQSKETGGNNLFFYAKEYWKGQTQDTTATLEEYTNTEIQQNNVSNEGYLINEGVSIQSQIVKNGYYVISFNYYKLKEDATGYIKINDVEHELDGTEKRWNEKVIPMEITSNNIKIEIGSDTEESYYIADLMVGIGTEKQVWSQNLNETRTDSVTIGKGIQVNSSITNTYTRIDADGNRVYKRGDTNPIAEFTDKGLETQELVVKNQAKINILLVQKIGSQIWLTGLGG